MQRRPQQTLAALLVTASLAMPGAAQAASLTGTARAVATDATPTAPVDPAELTVSPAQSSVTAGGPAARPVRTETCA